MNSQIAPEPVPADAPGIARYADALVAALGGVGVSDGLDPEAGVLLVDRLRDLHAAMRSVLPSAPRPKVGLIGRMFGRDVVAQQASETLAARMGVLLVDADRAAAALAADLDACRARIDATAPLLAQLDAAAAALRAEDAGVEAHLSDLRLRRAQHLDMVRATHAMSMQQWSQIVLQHEVLLARYRNIRDVLLPLWRQREAARDAASRSIEADVSGELDAMTATLAAGAAARARRPQENDA